MFHKSARGELFSGSLKDVFEHEKETNFLINYAISWNENESYEVV